MNEQYGTEMNEGEVEFNIIADQEMNSLVFEELDGLMASNNCGSCHTAEG